MNIGFFIGFTVAGMFQQDNSYNILFLLTTITNITAFMLLAVGWKTVTDKTTSLVRKVEKIGGHILLKDNSFAIVIIFLVIALLFSAHI